MKNALVALLLAAISLTAYGQASAQEYGPPPQMRTQMEQVRNNAKAAALNALSPDHRNRVQAIVDQVNSGSLDRQAAAQQIDAILTPSESQAVLAQGTKMRDAMRAMFQQQMQNGGQPPMQNGQPPMQNGQPPQGGGPGGWHRDGSRPGQMRTPDAGRMLIMLDANRPMMGRPR